MDAQSIWDRRYAQWKSAPSSEDDYLARHLDFVREWTGHPIIDLGCGRGFTSLALSEMGADVTACDFSAVALEEARSLSPRIKTMRFDMTDGLPFADGYAGVVIASLTTHYFQLDVTRAVYADVRRVLKEGGYFLLRVNSLDEYKREEKSAVLVEGERDYFAFANGERKRYFSPESLTELLCGFQVLSAGYHAAIYRGHEKDTVEAIARKPRTA